MSVRSCAVRRPSRAAVLLLTLVVGLTACRGTDEEPLADAAAATFDDAFGYQLAVRADEEAVDALGDAGGLLSVLSGLQMRGRVTETAGSEFIIEAAGLPVIELLAFDDEIYFRGALQDLFGVFGASGFDPRDEMVPALETLGVSDAMLGATLEAFDGNWIGIVGELDRERLAAALGQPVGTPATEASPREAFAGTLPQLIERYVIVEEVAASDEGTRYELVVDVDALVAALVEFNAQLATEAPVDAVALREQLGGLPDTVPGEALTVDGQLRRLEIHLDRAATDEAPGSLTVVMTFEPEVDAPIAPQEATTVPADDFVDAVERLSAITGLGGDPADAG